MFCPIRANKSRKSTHQAIRNRETNSQINNGHHTPPETNTHHATSIQPYRYVKSNFLAEEKDELTVSAGDFVLSLGHTDKDSNGDWSHVMCLKTNNQGFVPSNILSTDFSRIPQCKKKLPRSTRNGGHQELESHHLQPRHLHHNMHHDIGKPSSHGDTMTALHQHQKIHEHQARFKMSHSLHGSSVEQSFPKLYPDLRQHIAPPVVGTYYNLPASECIPNYGSFDMECIQFLREDHGLFVVTNNFIAREENDLNVGISDYVRVLNKDDDDWYWVRREYDHIEGFVPSRFICDYEQVKSILNKGNSTVTTKSSNPAVDCHTYINQIPDRESLPTDQQSSVVPI